MFFLPFTPATHICFEFDWLTGLSAILVRDGNDLTVTLVLALLCLSLIETEPHLIFSFLFAGLILVALSFGWATCNMPGGSCVFCWLVSLVPVPWR